MPKTVNQLSESRNAFEQKLRLIKLPDTAIVAAGVAVIFCLPPATWFSPFRRALGLTFLILGECLVLAFHRGRRPLTDTAGPVTDDRSDKFDIYLPTWLARHNKLIFGFCFVAGGVVWLWR